MSTSKCLRIFARQQFGSELGMADWPDFLATEARLKADADFDKISAKTVEGHAVPGEVVTHHLHIPGEVIPEQEIDYVLVADIRHTSYRPAIHTLFTKHIYPLLRSPRVATDTSYITPEHFTEAVLASGAYDEVNRDRIDQQFVLNGPLWAMFNYVLQLASTDERLDGLCIPLQSMRRGFRHWGVYGDLAVLKFAHYATPRGNQPIGSN